MTTKKPPAITKKEGPKKIVFIFQGGGALGSFQVGAYQILHRYGLEPCWISGISIGSINAAIIAGNPPEQRLKKLESFWQQITTYNPFDSLRVLGFNQYFQRWWSSMSAICFGQPHFFEPRKFGLYAPNMDRLGPEELSYYDTSPLRKTLDELIDWDYLNQEHVRLSLGASRVRSGRLFYFDNHDRMIIARHVMASGALPPGFPSVKVDGILYWDGGVVSNNPLGYVLENNQSDHILAIVVDLFSSVGDTPRSMMDVEDRQKEIKLASQSARMLNNFSTIQNLRGHLAELAMYLPEEAKQQKHIQEILKHQSLQKIDVLHLTYHAPVGRESYDRDYEFSRASMCDHIDAGSAGMESLWAYYEKHRHHRASDRGVRIFRLEASEEE